MRKKNFSVILRGLEDPALGRALLKKLEQLLDQYGRPVRFMEVCGTHTVSIFRSGLRSLLPRSLTHLSGPGCPVCVTHDSEIAAGLELAGKDALRVVSFGDMLRVPGPGGVSLKDAKARGARVDVVYSPQEALSLARRHPAERVVFLGVGFETTAPAVAACLRQARQEGVRNFFVLSLHKLVPPAIAALLRGGEKIPIDAFLLPGHVSAVLGVDPYGFIAEDFGRPGVISGFEPADILQSLLLILEALLEGKPAIYNQYSRVVPAGGNPRARQILWEVFIPRDAFWRGLGLLPDSGLRLREEYADFDAWRVFQLECGESRTPPGCRCGDVLRGGITPPECPLFGRTCTPACPAGPCMVSTEGSCAAYYNFQG